MLRVSLEDLAMAFNTNLLVHFVLYLAPRSIQDGLLIYHVEVDKDPVIRGIHIVQKQSIPKLSKVDVAL